MLTADDPDLEEIRLILDDISAADARAVEILNRIRALINREKPEFHPVELDALVRSTVHHMREEALCSEVRIALDLNATGQRVSGDVVQLEQALSNLIRNAIQAMEATAPVERLLTIRTSVSDAHTLEVAIQDRGDGVPNELQNDIFKPFYSTKPQGMGIGLAIARATLEMHSGHLWVTNNPDRGATFRLTLSVVKEGSQ
jgi:two-component system sensor kinase FixL